MKSTIAKQAWHNSCCYPCNQLAWTHPQGAHVGAPRGPNMALQENGMHWNAVVNVLAYGALLAASAGFWWGLIQLLGYSPF